MTGLEKMKSQILEEARSSADAKIQEARNQAKEILDEAKARAEKEAGTILAKAKVQADVLREKTVSSADLDRRTKILSAKQELIAGVLGEAYREVRDMDADSYFALIGKILEAYVLPQDGRIRFSPADAARMPAGFAEKIQETAEKKGGSLVMDQPDGCVPDGFVLIYGGVEENCTFEAIFDARRDELSDRVCRLLFS